MEIRGNTATLETCLYQGSQMLQGDNGLGRHHIEWKANSMPHQGKCEWRKVCSTLIQSNSIILSFLFRYKQIIDHAVASLPRLTSRATSKLIWQQDNAPAHTSRIAEECLRTHRVTVLPWPAYSPDLNIIENLWGIMARQLRGRDFNNEHDLWDAVRFEWRAIPQTHIDALYESIPRRLESVKISHGGFTKY